MRAKLFNRMEMNRYRYDDASYNTTPLYNRLGVNVALDLSSVNFWIQLSDDFRSGYQTEAMNGHKLVSMAGIDYRFYKKKCRLSLFVDDIFNKDIYYSSDYSAFKRTEYAYNYIHHYLNVTFSYRFDAKADKKKGKSENWVM